MAVSAGDLSYPLYFFYCPGYINSYKLNKIAVGRRNTVGKNKNKGINSDPMKEKTQELEDTKRISKGFHKNNPTKPK